MTQSYRYSGNVYQPAAGTTTFALTSSEGNDIAYLQKTHITVSKSTDEGDTWTDLSRPDDWDFDTEGTSVVLDDATEEGDWIRVRRNTPYQDRYTTFAESSLLTSDQLNTGEDFSMYVDQELSDDISINNQGRLTYRGNIDLTADDAPAGPQVGDVYINTGDGTVIEGGDPGWNGIVGDDVSGAEQVVYQSDGTWTILTTPASQAGVLGVTGTAPITVDNTDDQNPVVGIDAATTSAAGSMSSADKTKLDGVATGAEVNVNADWDATSGDAEILNKPTIPAAQVQSDWDQTDTAAVDFIENKPTIPAAQVNSDWDADSGVAEILNKPTIPAAQIQSDWDQTDTAALDFIQNKPNVLGDAPSDGNTYGRQDGAWSEVTATGGVTSIVAGTNITIDPTGGTGDVTINSTGGGGGGGDDTVGASAWGSVAGDGSVNASLNISTVTKGSTGRFSVEFSTSMPSADYSISGAVSDAEDSYGSFNTFDKTATGFEVITLDLNGNTFDYPFDFSVFATNGVAPLTGGTGTDAWGSISQDGDIEASFNIESVSRNDGTYTITFTTAMPTANYAVTASNNRNDNQSPRIQYKETGQFVVVMANDANQEQQAAFDFTVNATNAQLPNTLDEETIRAAAQNPGASAWGAVDRTTVNGACSVSGSLNIASVTRTATGKYDVVFTTPLPSADYSVVGSCATILNVSNQWFQCNTKTATGFEISLVTTNGSAVTNADADFNFQVFSQNALPPKGGTGTDAWGNIAEDGTIKASFNVASASWSSNECTVTFTTPMPTADYAITATAVNANDRLCFISSKSTTGFVCNGTDTGNNDRPCEFGFTVNATNAQLPDTFTEEQIQGVIDAGPEGIAKAWVNFDADGTLSVRDSFNVDSVTDNGTGDYTINFTNNMPNTNYCVVQSSGTQAGLSLFVQDARVDELTVYSVNYAGGNEDNDQQHIAIFAS